MMYNLKPSFCMHLLVQLKFITIKFSLGTLMAVKTTTKATTTLSTTTTSKYDFTSTEKGEGSGFSTSISEEGTSSNIGLTDDTPKTPIANITEEASTIPDFSSRVKLSMLLLFITFLLNIFVIL